MEHVLHTKFKNLNVFDALTRVKCALSLVMSQEEVVGHIRHKTLLQRAVGSVVRRQRLCAVGLTDLRG